MEGQAAVLPASSAEDVRLAIGNALKLSGSLAASWTIALAVRLVLPRGLGPDRFGALSSADALTTTAFVFLQLGVDTYVRTAVAVRPHHAREFFGGVLLLRGALAVALSAAMIVISRATGRSPEVEHLVVILCAAQLVMSVNGTLAALLQARGRVGGLAWATIAAKAIWGAGVLAALASGGSLVAIGAASLACESVKAVALVAFARRQADIRFSVDARATVAVLVASLPFFINNAAHTIYARVDITVLSFLASDREVGFYGAAAAVGQVTALLTPLIGWVLIPLFARAASRSADELAQALRRSIELCLSVAIPTSLALALGADLWVRLLFGSAFAPAAMALRVLAPLFVLTYAAVAISCALLADGRGWSVTAVSIGGLCLSPILNVVLIPRATTFLAREGGGGVGCALALLCTEAAVTFTMLSLLRGRAFDRRSLAAIGKMVAACAAATALDILLPLPSVPRLAASLLLYAGLALAWGAIRPGELSAFASAALRSRHASV